MNASISKLAKIDHIHPGDVALHLRGVALFEAGKAILILLLGCGAFDLLHKNVDGGAEQIALMVRIHPTGKLSHVFGRLATHVNDRMLWVVAVGALFDGTIRSIAAYALWRKRRWAEWFELLSTALYIPPEVYLLLRHPSWLKGSALAINLITVLVMMSLCLNQVSLERCSRSTGAEKRSLIGESSLAKDALRTDLQDGEASV